MTRVISIFLDRNRIGKGLKKDWNSIGIGLGWDLRWDSGTLTLS